MGRRGPARCNTCAAHIVFFRSPFTSKVRSFDAKPVEPSHPLAGVKVFPVLGGTAAYKPADLVDVLQVQRQTSDADAQAEVQDMPWFHLHECPEDSSTEEPSPHDRDVLRRATDLVVSTQFGSASMLQRHIGVSFAHATRILDELESHGVVGHVREAQSREVLVKPDQLGEVFTSMGLGGES